MSPASGILEAFLLLLVFATPLAFGGVDGWVSAAIEAICLGLGPAAFFICRRQPGPSPLGRLFSLTLAAISAVGILQVLNHAPAWGPRPMIPWTPSPQATLFESLRWLSLSSLAWGSGTLLRHPAQRRRLLWAIFCAGAAVAVVGLSQRGLGAWRIYGYRKVPDIYAIFGTFFNRNHAASYLAMALFSGAGLLASEVRSLSRLPPSDRYNTIARSLLIFFLLLITVAGILKSGSRGALFSLLPAVAVFGFVLQRRMGSIPKWMLPFAMPLAAFAAIFLLGRAGDLRALPIFSDGSTAQRLSIYASIVPFLKDSWLWGYGLGCVELAFPPYQDFSVISTIVDHLHNDWAEAAGQLGIPIALSLFAGFGLIAGRFLRQCNIANSQENALGAGMCAAVAAFAAHSFLDFPSTIPANAVGVVCLVAGACAISTPSDSLPYAGSARRAAVLAAGICALGAFWGLRRIPAWHFVSLAKEAEPEGRPYYYAAAAKALPGSEADYRLGTAYLTLAAMRPNADKVLLRKALTQADSALAQTPEKRRYQDLAASALWRLGKHDDAVWHLQRKRQ